MGFDWLSPRNHKLILIDETVTTGDLSSISFLMNYYSSSFYEDVGECCPHYSDSENFQCAPCTSSGYVLGDISLVVEELFVRNVFFIKIQFLNTVFRRSVLFFFFWLSSVSWWNYFTYI